MKLTDRDLALYIANKGIDARIVYLKETTPTVEMAAQAVGESTESIGKSLLFFAQDEPILVIANGTSRINYKSLAGYLNINRKKLRLADASRVLEVTGFPVGTVPPFGHKVDLRTLIENRVLERAHIYVGGGAMNALLRITTKDLVEATNAEIISL